MKLLITICLAFSLCLTAPLAGDPGEPDGLEGRLPLDRVLETFKDGWIDWTAGRVYAWGRSLPGSGGMGDADQTKRLEATVEARVRMQAILSKLRVSSEGLLSQREGGEEIIQALAGAGRRVQERVRRGSSLEVKLEVQLHGSAGLASALLGPADPPEPPGDEPGSRGRKKRDPTGVIVDARGTELLPAYLPRILAPGGEVLWSREQADPFTLRNRGLATYGRLSRVAGPEPAELEWRVHPVLSRMGRSPAVLRAGGSAGPLKADVVLDEGSAEELAGSEPLRRLLAASRLVILVD